MFNTSTIQGNIVADARIFRKEKEDGETVVARFTIANNRGFGDRKKSTFVDCVAFGRNAEFAEKFVKKGKQFIIGGELSQNIFEVDGQKRSRLEIEVRTIDFCGNSNTVASEVAETEEKAY